MERLFKYIKKNMLLLSAGLFCVVSCVEFEPVSPIPYIQFKEFEFYDGFDSLGNTVRRGVLELSFLDGDADIGVYDEVNKDTNLPDSVRFNLFLIPYYKSEGEYVKIDLSADPNTPDLFYLVPHDQKLDRVGQNKTVKGFIRVSIDFLVEPPWDTLMYEFYIMDRALNRSNTEQTVDFVIEIADTSLFK